MNPHWLKKIKDMTDMELLNLQDDDSRMTDIENEHMKFFGTEIDNACGNILSYRKKLREFTNENNNPPRKSAH